MDKGREREAKGIVRLKRAAVVGRLMLGKLDNLMEPFFVEQYLDKPRRGFNNLSGPKIKSRNQ